MCYPHANNMSMPETLKPGLLCFGKVSQWTKHHTHTLKVNADFFLAIGSKFQ
jgi:hypothetical protein